MMVYISLTIISVLFSSILVTSYNSLSHRTFRKHSTIFQIDTQRNNGCSSKVMSLYAEGEEVAAPAAPIGLRAQLMIDMKDAMKSKDKVKLSGVRAIQAIIKQKEVDERIVVSDDEAIIIMSKLIKQIKESIKSYGDAGRQDLVDKEQAELDVVQTYMPVQLSAAEVEQIVADCIIRLGATTIKDMGKVMADLKPVLTGKTDTSEVGALIKAKLGGAK